MLNSANTVLADLNTFNEKYARYMECNDPILNKENKLGCTDDDKDISTLNKSYTKLMNATDNGSVQQLFKKVTNYKYAEVDEDHINFDNIVNQHTDVVSLRKELDEKMKIINGSSDSRYDDSKKKLDNTMFNSILLSVIVTSSLFFIFKKI